MTQPRDVFEWGNWSLLSGKGSGHETALPASNSCLDEMEIAGLFHTRI